MEATPLTEHARSPEIEARARESTRAFHTLGANARPTFLLENANGDRVVLSGLAKSAPLIAAAEALLEDEASHIAYRIHHGDPPAA